MEISKTDIKQAARLLAEAARYYDQEARQSFIVGVSGTRYAETARRMRNLSKRLTNKINKA